MEAAKNVTIQIMDTNPVALTDISPQFDISLMPSDEDGIVEYLTKLKWPVGLQKLLIEGVKMIPAKFFVCDDSGTMMFSDGHKVIEDGGSVKLVSCSRWSEMTESLRFHIDLAGAAKAPTEFRLLNGANAINMGIDKESDEVSRAALFNQLEMYVGASPTKKRTPLSYHVNQVVDRIKNIAPQLRKSGKKAALVILTDGEASDGEIMSTLRRLKDLPVWVVVRLCTDNHKMVDYWNNVDSQVALSMDVLDDPHGEAKEIFRWLTYGEPLHRLREFGTIAKEMDLIDEAPLTMDEMKTMICHILNAKPSDLPNPVTDWDGFYKTVSDLNDAELPVWNPMTNKLERWIDLKRLKVQYGKSGATPISIGKSAELDRTNVPSLLAMFDSSPGGNTPLCYQLGQVIKEIELIAPQLRAAGKKAAIVIMTDGEASDGDMAAAMRPLEKLPVWIVIRLCTDEDKMVDYWNNIDSVIELNMDVIDDPLGEAREIHRVNSWLTYGEPLHRLREFGITLKEMDVIDEATLTMEQMRMMCACIFDVPVRDLPEPAVDWSGFESRVTALNDRTPMVWNPIKRRMTKWIDMHALKRQYARGSNGSECACRIA